MTKIDTTLQLHEELEQLLKKSNKQLVIEQNGDNIFCVEFLLGLRGRTCLVMQENYIASRTQQASLTQDSFESPAREEDCIVGTTHREKRGATRSLNASTLRKFKKYYLDDKPDNRYYHALCHEHRSVFLMRYENDSPDRRNLMNELNDGVYPSLDWILDNPVVDNTIPPGSKKWKPINQHGIPPYGLPKAKPLSIKNELKEALDKFLESFNETIRPEATMVNFFRIDRNISPNERYEIPVPPKYIRRAYNEENHGTGFDLLFQARYLARNKKFVPLFSANLQQYTEKFKDGSMKIHYKFNNCKYESQVFKKIRIDDIMAGNASTVQIEMIVEKAGAQMQQGDISFD